MNHLLSLGYNKHSVPFFCCVTSDKSLHHSELHFLNHIMRIINYLTRLQ